MEVEKLIGETTSLTLTGFKEGRRDTGDSRADEKPGRYSAKYGTSKIFQQKQESRVWLIDLFNCFDDEVTNCFC